MARPLSIMIAVAGATEPRALVDAFFPRSSVCRGQAVSLSLALCGLRAALPGRNGENSSFMAHGKAWRMRTVRRLLVSFSSPSSDAGQ